jgi:hypothetical protein
MRFAVRPALRGVTPATSSQFGSWHLASPRQVAGSVLLRIIRASASCDRNRSQTCSGVCAFTRVTNVVAISLQRLLSIHCQALDTRADELRQSICALCDLSRRKIQTAIVRAMLPEVPLLLHADLYYLESSIRRFPSGKTDWPHKPRASSLPAPSKSLRIAS